MKTKNNFWFLIAMLLSLTFTFSACGGGGDDDDDDVIPRGQQPNTPSDNNPNNPSGTLQLTQTCGTCNGNKACPSCNGTGKGCAICRNTGECLDCDETGQHTACRGSGKCFDCNGKGKWTCEACRGKGCAVCGRDGIMECTFCNATGVCRYCDGSGKCPTCRGTHKCYKCGGDGHCSACINSDGKCKECRGNGEIILHSFSFSEAGGNEIINIRCTSEWSAYADVDWISFSQSAGKGNGWITVTAAKNTTDSSRNGVLTFTCGSSKQTINVVQNGVSVLRNWLEKPMGIVDIDLKTASYQDIKYEITKSYVIFYEHKQLFIVRDDDNPSLKGMTYQGLTFASFELDMQYYYRRIIQNSFILQKPNDYQTYVDKILADFKKDLNVTLKEVDPAAYFKIYQTDDYAYYIRIMEYDDYYMFYICAKYK